MSLVNICFANSVYKTSSEKITFDIEDLKESLDKFIKSNSDNLKGKFERATKVHRKRKYDNGRIILKALASSKKEYLSHAELLALIKKEYPDYKQANLTLYLKKLQEVEKGAVISQNLDNGLFYFSDPFIKTYCQCVFESKDEFKEDPQEINRQMAEIIEKFVQNVTSKS